MGFGKRIVGGITLALAGATVFTAGSSHAAVAASGSSGAGTAAQAKVITWAMAPGAAPDWMFPVVPAADNSVSNVFSFEWNIWRRRHRGGHQAGLQLHLQLRLGDHQPGDKRPGQQGQPGRH